MSERIFKVGDIIKNRNNIALILDIKCGVCTLLYLSDYDEDCFNNNINHLDIPYITENYKHAF